MPKLHRKPPNVYIIAGPNGAGKTTFAASFLTGYAKCKHFVNADLIAQGGHHVPAADVRRRYAKSRYNFLNHYRQWADFWYIFDNSVAPPVLIAQAEQGKEIILEQALYEKI